MDTFSRLLNSNLHFRQIFKLKMFKEMHSYCGFIGLFVGKTRGHATFSVKKVRFTGGLREAKKCLKWPKGFGEGIYLIDF